MVMNEYPNHPKKDSDLVVVADPCYDHNHTHNPLSSLSKANYHTTLPIVLYIREL